jgi:hypothetical protein
MSIDDVIFTSFTTSFITSTCVDDDITSLHHSVKFIASKNFLRKIFADKFFVTTFRIV